MKKIKIVMLMVFTAFMASNAAVTSVQSGDYTDGDTWDVGTVPGSGSFVQISGDHTVALNSGTYTSKWLDVGVNSGVTPTFNISADYPHAFFFRVAEYKLTTNTVYESWESTFNRLCGITGKALGEEIPDRELIHSEVFTRFKEDHPDQLVLLHFNGTARDPRYESEKFSAGHWLYRPAVEILSDVPAESGETVIQVSSTGSFQTNSGRYGDAPSDIGLFKIKDGVHDWEQSEQVQLVSIDETAGTITVLRGCYGTEPMAFSAGEARAATHLTGGPWTTNNGHLLWYYNFSAECPRNSEGNTCSEVLVEELKEKMLSGGKLEAFDGIEFDAVRVQRWGDMNGDGLVDSGFVDGINTYGIGVTEFFQSLREALGETRLIMADIDQRAFGILNGLESEGWPTHTDPEIEGWSSGLNRHMFWNREGRSPVFNYINHKFNTTDIPFSTSRLVFAAAQFLDAAVCYSLLPQAESSETVGIWDELKKGTENENGWLGQPEGDAVHLAAAAGNLLEQTAVPATSLDDGNQTLTLDIDMSSSNLFITVEACGDPIEGYPEYYGREMEVSVGTNYPTLTSWVNSEAFNSTFYFNDISESQVTLTIEVESSEPVEINSITAHSAPDVMYRIFENGIVLANPSLAPYTFDLQSLTPGRTYRRLNGSSQQDTQTNNGEPVGSSVTLGAKDGLFLVRTD